MKLFGYKKSGIGRVLRILCLIIVGIVALGVGGWAVFNIYIAPPEQKTTDDPTAAGPSAEATDAEVSTASTEGRIDGMYTFLVMGEDNDAGGTDVIMVGRLDTNAGELNIISIPRDTMVNVPWETMKINSYKNMYGYLDDDYDNWIDAMMEGISNLIGFEVDSYITVNLDGFIALVDAIGGVEFDVPQNMYWSDPAQGLEINLKAGEQLLDGDAAMQVVRYREYFYGDLDRIEVQHNFLSALADQILNAKNITKIGEFVDIFEENVTTDMTNSNLLWYANEFLALDTDSIHFYTSTFSVT